jgi:radical SAM superfamily enzyme YgiQ (UPF0313 family)
MRIMDRRIALVAAHAGRADAFAHWPHYGLVLLGSVLRASGFEARVFDQAFLRCDDEAIAGSVRAFSPDLIGVSLYTTHATRGLKLAERLRAVLPAAPLIAGGPHVSLYPEPVASTRLFAALVTGEADTQVASVVERVLRGETPGLVAGGRVAGRDIPAADFQCAEGRERMHWMPIQLSRGCPFNCCFCEVREIAGRTIRYRDVGACLDEIERNLRALDAVHTVRIVDDCPTLDRPRFKGFLREYLRRQVPARISVDNMRADTVDEELVDLLKACRTPHICLGVESGNPAVFGLVEKGETLEDIVAAAGLIRKAGVPLQLCFVVGLPGSRYEAEMDSLRLAKRLKPDIVYWNMFLPHKGTRAREWFERHGTIHGECDVFSLPDYDLRFTLPPTETPEFSRQDRVRAWLRCVLETASFRTTPGVVLRAFALAVRHGIWGALPAMVTAIPAKTLVYARLLAGRLRERSGRRRGRGGPT